MRAGCEGWIIAMWAVLASAILCLPVAALLGQSVLIDDTFYALAAARHLAAGDGSTVDGVHATSGYQPLWVWLIAGVTALGRLSPEGTVRAALVLCAACTLLCGLRLARLTRVLGGGGVTAGVALLLWLLNPYLLRRQFNGLESVLAAWLLVETVLWSLRLEAARGFGSWGRCGSDAGAQGAKRGSCGQAVSFAGGVGAERRMQAPMPAQPRALELGAGVLAGLAALARIDLLILVPLLALRRRWIAAGVATVVSAPWLAWCWIRFGSPVPSSGQASRLMFAILHDLPEPGLLLWDSASVSFTFASLLGLGWPAAGLQRFGFPSALVWILVPLALLALWGLAAIGGGSKARLKQWWVQSRALARWMLPLAAYLGVAYALVYPAPWHLNRYFLPLHALFAVGLALYFGRGILGHRWRQRLWWAAWGAGLVAGLTPYLIDTTGGQPPSLQLEVARWIREEVPPDWRVAAIQSGVVGYYAARPITNLDGKVNPLAFEALRSKRMWEYLELERIDLFGDWEDLTERFVFARAGSEVARLRTTRLSPQQAGAPARPFAFYRIARP
ncbi:MAG: hypothetical protein V3U98_09585 [Acidobacteriota bacterium]